MTRRGFAAMDPVYVRELAREGGRAAHVAGTAHEFTSEEAKAAGRKGGLSSGGRAGCLASASARELRRLRALVARGVDGRSPFDTRPLWVRALEGRRRA